MSKQYHLAFAAGSTADDQVPELCLVDAVCPKATRADLYKGIKARDRFRAREFGGKVRCAGCNRACLAPDGINDDQEFRINPCKGR